MPSLKLSPKFLAILLVLNGFTYSQSWSGILSPARAIDWAQAGVSGGIPSGSWSQCGSTIAAGASAATINSAIQNCAANHYVQLGAGTFNLSTGLVMKSGVVLRGAGADQTLLNFNGVNTCIGSYAAICFAGGDSSDYFGSSKVQPGGSNAANWTAGYAQGATQITLSNIGSNGISVGKYIYLDQAEDTSTNSGFFICESSGANPPCSAEGGKGDPGRVINNIARQAIQVVKVTACNPSCSNGATFSITPGLYAPNYVSGKSPGAWWPSSTITNAGIEDLSVDATSSGGNTNVEMFNAMNVWVKGTRQVRSCQCNRSIIQMHAVAHATIEANYIYGTSGQSQNYGVESYIASDVLVLNNIFQHVVSPMMVHSNTGSVYAYNFAIHDTYDDGRTPKYHYLSNAIAGHSAGVMYNLFEGNVGPGLGGDAIHGNQVMNTAFRNWWKGSDPGRIDALIAINLEAWNRYWNIVGNVLGTAGVQTSYAGGSPAIYGLGGGRSNVPDDNVLAATMMRWGNYDTVNGSTRFVNAENGSSAPTYAGLNNPSQNFPASFFLSSKPLWWPSDKPWPLMGPDVTGGNVNGYGGHVNTTPAQDCFLNVMGGPTDGSGPVLAFNADACYVASGNAPDPPQGVTAVAH